MLCLLNSGKAAQNKTGRELDVAARRFFGSHYRWHGVPNDYNPIQKIFIENSGEVKWWLAPPFHLNYFDKSSLENLIRKSGFEVMHSTVMFSIDFFLLMGDVYIGKGEIGKAAHERRRRFEQSFKSANALDVMRNIYDALASIDIGRELVVFARKPE